MQAYFSGGRKQFVYVSYVVTAIFDFIIEKDGKKESRNSRQEISVRVKEGDGGGGGGGERLTFLNTPTF